MRINKQLLRLITVIFIFSFLLISAVVYYQLQISSSKQKGLLIHTNIQQMAQLNKQLNFAEISLIQIASNEAEHHKTDAISQLNSSGKILNDIVYFNYYSAEAKDKSKAMRQWIVDNRLFLLETIRSKDPDKTTFINFLNSSEGISKLNAFEEDLQQVTIEQNGLLTKEIERVNTIVKNLMIYGIATCFIFFILFIILIFQLNNFIIKKTVAENKLVINEKRYDRLLNQSDLVLFTTDTFGTFTFVSQKATELTGYDQDELLNKSFLILIDPRFKDQVIGFYKEQLKQNQLHVINRFRIVTKTGMTKWVEQSSILIYENNQVSGFQCTVKDINDTVLLEEANTDQYFKLQSILDFSPSIAYIKDLEGRYILVNREFKKFCNLPKEMIIGKTDFDLTDERSARKYKGTDDKVIQLKEVVEYEEILKMEAGVFIHIIKKFPLYDKSNNMYGIGCITTDITEIAEFRRRLRDDRNKAESSEKMQELFLASMSHEIRTPMNAILGMIREMKKTNLSIDQQKLIDIMHSSSDHLLVIINDILDVSKIQAGKLEIEKTGFDLREVTKNCMQIISHRVNENVSLNLKVDEGIAQSVKGDPYRIKQVLLNLLSNAAKFTEQGFIELKCNLLKQEANMQQVQLVVSDTGKGMDEQYLEKIFDKFSQEESSVTRKHGGTGLGMFITKNLVELMGGSIKLISKKGEGSSFEIIIPVEISTAVITDFGKKEIVYDSGSLKNVKILLVDDNEINRLIAATCLNYYSPEIDEASNGLEAIEAITNNDYDVILMDIQMPELDGYSATKIIREKYKLNVPIIALTASALSGEIKKGMQFGMNDYITKPFDEAELIQKVLYWARKEQKIVA
ncbi:MAG: PAS domain S-box protein [Lacibacter sp.]